MGRIDMAEDSWDKMTMVLPEARDYKNKPFPNLDVFEEEFRTVVVTGAEGWSAQMGEASLSSRVDGDEDDEADTGYLGPHCNMRYHLGQFAIGGPPVSARELFNRKHAGLRSVIERTFGVWKAKWRILDRKHPKYGITKWIKLVTATMALHNFIRDSHREDQDFVLWQEEDDHGGDEEEDGDGEDEEGEDGYDSEDDSEDGDDNDDDQGGHITYQPTGDRVMEALHDNITNEYGRGHLPY